MNAWIYVLDVFKSLAVELDNLLMLAEENPLKLFDNIKNIVENELGTIKSVKVYEIYFNPTGFEVLIEYIVECDVGKVSVKLIYSENPQKTLMHYYEYERTVRQNS